MEAKVTTQPDRREVILLLPGMTMNRTIFPAFDHPTLALDFNAAPPPHERNRPAMTDYVAELDRFLAREADEWELRRRIIVAHSFGGMLALRWLISHGGAGPARIDGLVLVATTAGPVYDVVGIRIWGTRDREWRIPFAPFRNAWNSTWVTRTMKRLTSGELAGSAQDFRSLRHSSDVAIDLAGWRNTDWRAMQAFRWALEGFDVRGGLPGVSVPTIVLHGTRDLLLPLATARELAAGIPGAELRVVQGAGHALPLTHGREVERAVEELLQETGSV